MCESVQDRQLPAPLPEHHESQVIGAAPFGRLIVTVARPLEPLRRNTAGQWAGGMNEFNVGQKWAAQQIAERNNR